MGNHVVGYLRDSPSCFISRKHIMHLSPTLHKYATAYNCDTIIEDNIDFWYDSLNDCYTNSMPIEMICTYVEAIIDEDTE